jgi:hypothetical protein
LKQLCLLAGAIVLGACSAPPQPACDDGLQNGDETGVDCGGGTCGRCALGGHCAKAADCISGVCSGSTCVAAMQSQPPVIDSFIAAPASLGAGQAAMLTATFRNGTGVLDNGIGAVTSGTPISTGPLAATTSFTLTVTGSASQTVTQSVTVTVVSGPVITAFTAADPMVGVGAGTTLTATFAGGTGSIDHGIGTVTSGMAVPTGPLMADTTFTLTVMGSAGAAVTQTVTVSVVAPPAISAFTAAQSTLTAGNGTTLTASFSGGTGSIDHGLGPAIDGVAVSTGNLTVDTTFTLTVTNAVGDTVTQTASVMVVPAPAITSFTATPSPVTTGTATALTAVFTGGSGSVDHGLGAATSGMAVPTGNLSADTTFTLTVTNAAGDSVTKAATVMAVPPPGITGFTAAQSTVTAGTGTTLTATFTGGTATVDHGIGAVTSGVAVPTGNLSSDTTFTLTVTNAAGTSVMQTASVSAVAAPVIGSFTAAKNRVVPGGATTLTAAFTGGTGSVDNGVGAVMSGVAAPTGTLNAPTTFTLTVTNAAGTSVTGTARVDVGPIGTQWAKRAGCGTCSVYPNVVVPLADNGFVSTGVFAGATTSPTDQPVFGPGEPGQTTLVPPTGFGEIWVGRFNADGTAAWAKHAGGNGDDHGNSARLLDAGTMLVTGSVAPSSGGVVFGPGEPTQAGVSGTAGQLLFQARYGVADGAFVSVKTSGGTASTDRTSGAGIAVYPDGTYTICGLVVGNAIFGAGETTQQTFATGASPGLLLAHYDASGAFLWGKVYAGATSNDGITAMQCHELADGGLIVTGEVQGTVTLGTDTLTAVASQDMLIARFDASGDPVWARSAGTSSTVPKGSRYAGAPGLAMDSDGSAVVVGWFGGLTATGGSITFGTQTVTTTTAGQASFVVRYAPDGSVAWAKGISASSSSSSTVAYSVVLTAGALYVSGNYSRGGVFGGGEANQTTLVGQSPTNDQVDVFIASYDPATGALQYARRAATANGTQFFSGNGLALAARPDGALLIGGEFGGNGTFGPDDPGPVNMSAAGQYDLFFATWWPY